MTRCMRNVVNLKSTAYNQTGQRYFEQLTAYNSMSSHLRRILLAKSTIDTGNKNYLLKKKQLCKVQDTDNKRAYLHSEVINDLIEKLAYDTQHHPMDVLRMNFNLKHPDYCNNLNCHQSRICDNHIYYEENRQIDHQQQLMSINERRSPMISHSTKHKKLAPNFVSKKEQKSMQWRKCRHEKDPPFVSCTTTLNSSIFKSESQSLIQKINHLITSNASQTFDLNYDDKIVDQCIVSKQCSSKKEEKKYIKFVYDITKEIIQKGLYTDKELQDVFKKHIEQYKGILNMNKMLYEIYQLKISLNIVDSDTDDELEDLIHAQKLLSVSEIRPPTPPKILDENKVMEKLESYQKMIEAENRPFSAIKKSVKLVDANPELFVTERDVLISLMEAGVDPKQAQYICKNLLRKSKDTTFDEAVQVDAEAYLDLKVNNSKKLCNNDVSTSSKAETIENIYDSTINYSVKSSVKQETCPSISNLDMQDETIEIKNKMESQSIIENDNKMKNDKIES